MSCSCVIRNAEPGDAEAIAKIISETENAPQADPQVFPAAFEELVNTPWACLLVAEEQSRPVGFLYAFHHPDLFKGNAVCIETILVAKSHQNQGIGSMLLAEAEKWAAKCHAAIIVVPAAPKALAFYNRLGYKEAAFRLVKALSPSSDSEKHQLTHAIPNR